MTHENGNERDDERLAALLRAVDADVPQPDRALLDTLRQRSAELFVSNLGDANRADASAAVGEPPAINASKDVLPVESPTQRLVSDGAATQSSSDDSPTTQPVAAAVPSRAHRKSRR